MIDCQRWRDGREYIVRGDRINPADFDVDVITERVARPFVEQHHYSGSYPAARLAVGLFRGTNLVGAAVFSVPMNNAAIPKWTGLEAHAQGVELGRLVLLDSVAAYGESWFVARAFRALRIEKPGVESVLSYADPVERRDSSGRMVKPGHVGTVYQALNASYRGLARPRTDYFTPFGELVSRRALSKVRLDEIGAGYAIEQLRGLGAPPRQPWETGRRWIERLMYEDRWLTGIRHPGNHTYTFALTKRARRAAQALPKSLAPRDYPKLHHDD